MVKSYYADNYAIIFGGGGGQIAKSDFFFKI